MRVSQADGDGGATVDDGGRLPACTTHYRDESWQGGIASGHYHVASAGPCGGGGCNLEISTMIDVMQGRLEANTLSLTIAQMASSTPEGIKTLLAAATALLAPPAPLPSAPPALLERLRASSALLPGWRTRAGWTDDDELEQIGDDDDEASPARKERRDALVQLVGRRCLDILLALQAILGKEFWPAEFKDGMGDKDCGLGVWGCN